MTICFLSKQGYGTVDYLESLDTPELLNLVEFEMIQQDIQAYKIDEAKNK